MYCEGFVSSRVVQNDKKAMCALGHISIHYKNPQIKGKKLGLNVFHYFTCIWDERYQKEKIVQRIGNSCSWQILICVVLEKPKNGVS